MIQKRKRTVPAEENAAEVTRLLLPIASLEEAQLLLPLTEALVRSFHSQLIILTSTMVPEGHSLSEGTAQASRLRQQVAEALTADTLITAQIKTSVRSGEQVWAGIWETVETERIDLLLLAWPNASLPHASIPAMSDPRLAQPPCDIVVVYPAEAQFNMEGWKGLQRLLLPVRGGPEGALSLRIGHALADYANARISLLHVTSPQDWKEEDQYRSQFEPVLRGLDRVTRAISAKGEIGTRILKEARDHQLVIMGASRRFRQLGVWEPDLLDEIQQITSASVVLVWDRAAFEKRPLRKLAPAVRPIDRPVAVLVDQWFAENTYHSQEFTDLVRLLTLKLEQNLTISLGLPALNEENTVGKVIRTIKTALMDDVPLLDEIVLIDSGSVDYTREIAANLGIPVYIHQEILPQYGAYTGKGEALWKSLHVLKGDIVAWIDTDIRNIHPRFVYGILGPLLRDPKVQYVKGFYRRPLRQDDRLVAGGGGRVTELTARPFFNLFFPELSGLIQPLAGEYAGRRQALERMPFFTGYGVETGLLIDLLEEYGLNAIAQVDLLERVHHNQPLGSLSKMSFAIMQVVFSRLEQRHGIDLMEDTNRTMNRILYEPRRYYLQPEEIIERERPPILTLPEYGYQREALASKPAADEHSFQSQGSSRPATGAEELLP